MQAFVITIFGLPLSEAGARRCITSGAEFGQHIEAFSAVTRYDATEAMQRAGLKLNHKIYCKISDQAIGDRDLVPQGQWRLTTPELGCFMSHYTLWNKCAESNDPLIILEHDIRVIAHIPELPGRAEALNLFRMEYPNTAAYVLGPRGARRAIKEAKRRGIQPSDELLWRAALRTRPVADVPDSVVALEDNGFSTIQFSRKDATHERIVKTDPWTGFSGKKTS